MLKSKCPLVWGMKQAGEMPGTSETLRAQLIQDFRWRADRSLTGEQLSLLLASAEDFRGAVENYLGASGREWMREKLGGTHFHLGGIPQRIASWVNKQPVSIVFPRRHVWLAAEFTGEQFGRQHIAHELGHVLDNCLGSNILPAAIFGGGPADGLIRWLGGRPGRLRFRNGLCGIDEAYHFPAHNQHAYGNTATAEYFAECLSCLVYHPERLPGPAIEGYFQSQIFRL